MKRIKIDETEIKDGEVIFPIEFNSDGFIINSEEILYSTRYKIDKNSINEKLEKVYSNDTISKLREIDDEYRDINLKARRFKLNKVYIMHNVSHFDGGYKFSLFYFVKEEDGIYAYHYNILDSIEKYDFTEYLSREALENIFLKDGLDGYYVVDCSFGLRSAFNSIDGFKENNFIIPSDDEIVEIYNAKKRNYNNFTPRTIEEIKNYHITKELFRNQYFLIKVLKEKIYFASFNIRMLEKNLFKCGFTIYNIGYFRDNLLTKEDKNTIKLLLEERRK